MIAQQIVQVDIAIVGAGLAGTAAAHVLTHAGHAVALIDTHAVYPADFRAEKMGAQHMALFERLGLSSIAANAATAIDAIDIYRFGRLFAKHRQREYGFAYADIVNGLRGTLPAGCHFVVDRVATMETGPDRQRIGLADGSTIEARLLVVATGLGDVVRRGLGIKRVVRNKTHSLSLGFDLARPADDYPFQSLAWYGRSVAERCAYLTLFPIGRTMRANLFVYRTAGEDWTKEFRRDPERVLADLMPGLDEACRGIEIASPVEMRPIDLIEAQDYRRPGVVLLGDAFMTTCPVPGVGVERALTDVERLCGTHVPAWFATSGMGEDKIAAFYDDPVKRTTDDTALRASHRSRAMATDERLIWEVRRRRNAFVRRGLSSGASILNRLRGSGGAAPSFPSM